MAKKVSSLVRLAETIKSHPRPRHAAPEPRLTGRSGGKVDATTAANAVRK
jgi:hypothetical protein